MKPDAWRSQGLVVPHFAAVLLFALLVSIVFGVLSRDNPRDRLLYGLKSFGLFVGIALALGWAMYLLGR